MTKNLLLAAAGVALSVAFTLIGMSIGMSQAETIAKTPPMCTVEDQRLAEYRRAKEIDTQIEEKIEYMTQLAGKIGYLKGEKQSVEFELQQTDAELLRTSVELQDVKRALKAQRAKQI